jgi:DNA repair photolyase
VVGINVAPIIPGLNDEDIGAVLNAARQAGAKFAGSVLLRLPGPVREVFLERLKKALPLRAEKVIARIRDVRSGKLYDSRFAVRGKGEGAYAEAIGTLFQQTARRLGFDTAHEVDVDGATTFERPLATGNQLALF